MDSDSDEERREKELPPYRIRCNDMPVKLVKEVVRCKFDWFDFALTVKKTPATRSTNSHSKKTWQLRSLGL